MAKKAITTIEIEGGKPITRFTRLTLNQPLFGHHEFQLQVPIEVLEGEGVYVFKESKSLIGKQITIAMVSGQLNGVQSPIFSGLITNVGFARAASSGNDVLISGKSTTVLLDNGANCRSFEEKSLADMVEEVLAAYPANILPHQCEPNYEESIPYLVQYRESDFTFLQRLADRYGEWCFYDGSELRFGKQAWPEAIPLVLNRELFEFQVQLSLKPIAHEAQHYDYAKSETYQASAASFEPRHAEPIYGEPAFTASKELFGAAPAALWEQPSPNQNALDWQIETQIDQKASDLAYLEAASDYLGVGLGRCVAISGAKSEEQLLNMEAFGEFIVVNVQHFVGGNGEYRNHFRAIPKEAGIPPPNRLLRPIVAEPESAVVKENMDPDKLGRVRVKFHWQKEGDLSPWIRLISSHAGGAGGFYVVPEKGDEVIVAYEHYRPDRPFVLGAVYNKANKPADNWIEDDNNVKAIKTKSGNEIILCDTGGSEAVTILNKGGTNSITLTMDSGGSITIATNNQMNLTGKNILISADENIVLNAKNLIASTTQSAFLSAGDHITAAAGETLALSATKDAILQSDTASLGLLAKTNAALVAETGALNVQADGDVTIASDTASVTINGKTNVDIAASMQINLSGEAMANFSSTGPVIVSGALVQLN